MKHPLLKLEPLIWLLFGQGILLGTVLLTPWVLVVGLGIPLGIVPAEALSYERAYTLASHIVGRVILRFWSATAPAPVTSSDGALGSAT